MSYIAIISRGPWPLARGKLSTFGSKRGMDDLFLNRMLFEWLRDR